MTIFFYKRINKKIKKQLKDKKYLVMAGPVIKTTGIKIRKIEKNSTSNDISLSKNKDLKGINETQNHY